MKTMTPRRRREMIEEYGAANRELARALMRKGGDRPLAVRALSRESAIIYECLCKNQITARY